MPFGVTLSKVTAGAVVLDAGESAGADDGTGPAGAPGGLGPVDAVGSLGPRDSVSGPTLWAAPTGAPPGPPRLAGSVIRAVGTLDGAVVVVVDGSVPAARWVVVAVVDVEVAAGWVVVGAGAAVVVVVDAAPDERFSGSVVVVEVADRFDVVVVGSVVDVLDDACDRLRVEVVVSARSFSAVADVVELSRFSRSLSSSSSEPGSGSSAATTPALTSDGGRSSADRVSSPPAARHPAPTSAIPVPSFERQPMHVPG